MKYWCGFRCGISAILLCVVVVSLVSAAPSDHSQLNLPETALNHIPRHPFKILDNEIENGENVDSSLVKAIAEAKSQQFDAAISDLGQMLQTSPNDYRVYCLRGACLLEKGDYDGAIGHLLKAVQLNQSAPKIHYLLALAYVAKHREDLAVTNLDEELKLNPTYFDVQLLRANCLRLLKKGDQAVAGYTTALSVCPGDARAYLCRGAAYHYALGQYQKAIDDYNKSASLDLKFAPLELYKNRARAYKMLKQNQKAIDDYTRFIALSATDSGVFRARGEAYQALGQVAKAKADYAKATSLDAAANRSTTLTGVRQSGTLKKSTLEKSGKMTDINYGPYMADLQRRIKRAWFPPKGEESNVVVLLFKIHTDGSMSHLRLKTSSGSARSDMMALKAAENAAPYGHLPNGAPPDIDIEFTFDHNKFGDGGRGIFRRF